MASKSKKGLGRGLGALFDDSKSEKSSEGFDFLSDLSDTEIADSDSIKMIKVSREKRLIKKNWKY